MHKPSSILAVSVNRLDIISESTILGFIIVHFRTYHDLIVILVLPGITV